jgi:hypothetical protein
MGMTPAPFPRKMIYFDGKTTRTELWAPTLADEEQWIREGGDSTFTEWCEKRRR